MRLASFMLSLLVACLSVTLPGRTAAAQSVADFYRGKTITCFIGYGVGGGYDLFARTISRHMSRHIPGNPAINPVNMPGASSLVLGNHLAKRAPRDGTAIGAADSPLLFNAPEMTMLGNPVSSAAVLIPWHTPGIKTIDDLRRKPLVIGAPSRTGDTYLLPLSIKNILGLDNLKIITGYPGTREIAIALE